MGVLEKLLPALGAAALLGACSTEVPGAKRTDAAVDYDPAADPWVNPAFLSQPFPTHRPELAEADATLVRHIGADPTTLNPIFNLPWQDHYLHILLFLNPIRRNIDMEVEINPVVVESWEESDDHKVFTLHLRPEARWQDGRSWTAHDIAFSFEVISDDRVPALFYKRSAERLLDVRALDDHTVQYIHREALPTRLRDMSFPVIPRHRFDNAAERAADPTMRMSAFFSELARRQVLGSGPYRFVEWTSNDRVVVERWEDYPFEKPRFARQIFKIVPDINVALLLFKRGEIDEMSLSGQQFATQTNDALFRRVGVKSFAPRRLVGGLGWNQDGSNPFFADRRVRWAMSHAFDTERHLKHALYGVYRPSRGIFDPEHWAYNDDIEPVRFDLKEAARLLDEAGWIADEEEGWRYKTIGGRRVRFEFEIMMVPGIPSFKSLVDMFTRDLRRIGVSARPLVLEGATLTERLRDHDYDAYVNIVEVTSDPDEWSIYWSTDGYDDGYNFGGYSNPRVDELFAEARRLLDRAERRPLYQEIQRLLYEDQAGTWVYDYNTLWAFNNHLRGVENSVSGPILFYPGLQSWWKAKEPGRIDGE